MRLLLLHLKKPVIIVGKTTKIYFITLFLKPENVIKTELVWDDIICPLLNLKRIFPRALYLEGETSTLLFILEPDQLTKMEASLWNNKVKNQYDHLSFWCCYYYYYAIAHVIHLSATSGRVVSLLDTTLISIDSFCSFTPSSPSLIQLYLTLVIAYVLKKHLLTVSNLIRV